MPAAIATPQDMSPTGTGNPLHDPIQYLTSQTRVL